MKPVLRVFLVVLDSVGCGALPDASSYGDEGAHTLLHILEKEPRKLKNLESLGLGNIVELPGVASVEPARAFYGKMMERSAGKDTTTGHWEMVGLVLEQAFPTYPSGFPAEVIVPFEEAVGKKVLGNKPASGTVIIDELGPEHVKTGRPIVYTSADSVFQIAAHEEIVPIEKLYEWCEIARAQLTGEHAVSRVIARPFIGEPGSFERTPRRHDFSLAPTGQTQLDVLTAKGHPVYGIGKISDIFCGHGVGHSVHTESNADGLLKIDEHFEAVDEGLIFANLVDFDMKFGHRNDVRGYADALAEFDRWLGGFLPRLHASDLLIVTADHGCDPCHPGTDHTREHVPLLVYRPGTPGKDLGTRGSFTDIAATLAEVFHVEAVGPGTSFLGTILED